MLIVATAGHIDHGKTSLVRALTGVDTDRLPEERARGISIDLGFAYWEAAPGQLVAFVDVPGHQGFIRNMLAGVAAIHFALVVVATDDGVMPQTREHVHILDFLGVRRGVVVLSKADTATPQRIAAVEADVRRELAGTMLAGLPALAVSARSGAGISQLLALLAQAVQEHEQGRAQADAQPRRTRFAIDRVFSVKGAGTVATGTLYDGELACEDRLQVVPTGLQLRVRGIQVHGRDVRRVGSGERAALNLAGADQDLLARGQWLADPQTRAAGHLMDVRLALLEQAPPLRHANRTRLYLGASEVACRVLLHGKAQLEPGCACAARLHLEAPLLAVNGDRFVLRDGPATQTLAGGIVVDPMPALRRRLPGEQEFSALELGEPTAALRALLKGRGDSGVDLARFERIFNLGVGARDAALQACDAVALGKSRPRLLAREAVEALAGKAAKALREDARPAVRLSDLHQALAPGLPQDAFEALLRENAERLDISLAGGAASLRGRRDSVRTADQAAWERVRPRLAQAGLRPPGIEALASSTGVPAGRLRAILNTQSRAGEVFQVQPDKFLVRELVAQLAVSAAQASALQPEGRFTAAHYRDAIGTGRTLAIHVLEMLDAAGITQRQGDARTIVRQPQAVFGPASPYGETSRH